MFDPASDFDLDIRFHGPSNSSTRQQNLAATGGCPIPIPPTVAFENTCGQACNTAECPVPLPPTLAVENTCGDHATCGTCECPIPVPPTEAFEQTCQNTCAPQQTCPVNTCGLDCETDTCPDATCGCNTNETCNQDKCQGTLITAPPQCDDPTGADDTCDACGGTGGCGNPDDTDGCTGGAACTNEGCTVGCG